MTKKNNIVSAYVRYYHERIAPEENEQRRLAFALLLTEVAEKIHGPAVAITIALQIITAGLTARTAGERAPGDAH